MNYDGKTVTQTLFRRITMYPNMGKVGTASFLGLLSMILTANWTLYKSSRFASLSIVYSLVSRIISLPNLVDVNVVFYISLSLFHLGLDQPTEFSVRPNVLSPLYTAGHASSLHQAGRPSSGLRPNGNHHHSVFFASITRCAQQTVDYRGEGGAEEAIVSSVYRHVSLLNDP
jgi:hypothetical protein